MITVHDHLVVLEVRDEITLKELAAAVDLERFIIRRLAPRVVVLDPKQVGPLLTQLRRRGYTPKVSGGEGE